MNVLEGFPSLPLIVLIDDRFLSKETKFPTETNDFGFAYRRDKRLMPEILTCMDI